jgi:hypothetical protein
MWLPWPLVLAFGDQNYCIVIVIGQVLKETLKITLHYECNKWERKYLHFWSNHYLCSYWQVNKKNHWWSTMTSISIKLTDIKKIVVVKKKYITQSRLPTTLWQWWEKRWETPISHWETHYPVRFWMVQEVISL